MQEYLGKRDAENNNWEALKENNKESARKSKKRRKSIEPYRKKTQKKSPYDIE